LVLAFLFYKEKTSPVPVTRNIVITAPGQGDQVSSPVEVNGLARAFENMLVVRLRAKDGTVLAEQPVMANSPAVGQYGPYSLKLDFNLVYPTDGVVEAFQRSAKDGSEIDKVIIPVYFTATRTPAAK